MLRERCKNDLWFFAFHVLEMRDMDNPLHRDMAARWQARKDKRFSLWMVPRGHLKTSLWTEAGTLWEFINDPDQRCLIVNAKLDNAIAFLANLHNPDPRAVPLAVPGVLPRPGLPGEAPPLQERRRAHRLPLLEVRRPA